MTGIVSNPFLCGRWVYNGQANSLLTPRGLQESIVWLV
jgi:hypothetical protein